MAATATKPAPETLRACPRFTVKFDERPRGDGCVAAAVLRTGDRGAARRLTVEEVALLSALDSPRRLPGGLRRGIRNCDQAVARLILDGLIEVRRGGKFQSGAAALKVAGAKDTHPGEAIRISELALQYALAMRAVPERELANRLYRFNSLPWTAISRNDPAAEFTSRTGIDANDPSPRIGGRRWSVQTHSGWLYFRRGDASGGRFKVYLCPHPNDVPGAIAAFAEVLGQASGAVFKVAFPADLLVRADKIVTYFPTFDTLREVVAHLAHIPRDGAVQAVPFTAAVPGAPLLSWGVDPPNLAAKQAASWRSWVTRQVAECVHHAPEEEIETDRMEHLKTAIRLRGIDPVQWLPEQELLSREWRLEL